MGEILIKKKDGTELYLTSYDSTTRVTKARHLQEMLTVDRIDISIESSKVLNLSINDKIIHEGKEFFLNLNPKEEKKDATFFYELSFEGLQYLLLKKKFFNADESGNYTTGEFPLSGGLQECAKMVIANANRAQSANAYKWVLGTLTETDFFRTIDFSNENTLQALQKICKEFDTEFEITVDDVNKSYILNFGTIGRDTDFVFEEGFNNGLYGLTRENVGESHVITRLYPFGSTENIPSGYRDFSQRLKLPLSFGKDYIQDDAKVVKYGLNEEIIPYDDIKPTFKGELKSVAGGFNSNNTYSVEAKEMSFDLMAKDDKGNTKYLINGTPAIFNVLSGALAGYKFEIHKYEHDTKTFFLKKIKDQRGHEFPDLNSVLKLNAGDTFTLTGIVMPQVYIEEAETRLLEFAKADYEKRSQNKVKYSLAIDPMHLVNLGFTEYTKIFAMGDYVRVTDKEMDVDKKSRIVSLSRDLLNLFDYEATISDTYEIGLSTQILQDIKTIKTTQQTQTQVNAEMLLSGYRRYDELEKGIFDVDGNFDAKKFGAESINAMMLSVGARSQQLTLKDVVFTPNFGNDVNAVRISAGELIHFSINEMGIKRWSLSEINVNSLHSGTTYYIYARCSRTSNAGTFEVTTEQKKFDAESEVYCFLLGVLFGVQNNVRLIHLNYGATYINGRVITTGRIVSLDGLTWFDLDTGEFRGNFVFRNGENVENAVNNARALANQSLAQLSDIASDSKLTANEKNTVLLEWNKIKTEVAQNVNVGSILKVNTIAYQNAFNDLNTYLTVLLQSMTITSEIDRNTFNMYFENYYSQNVKLIDALELARIGGIVIGGRNLALDSFKSINSNSDFVADFDLSTPLQQNEEYTVTVRLKVPIQINESYFYFGDQSGQITDLKQINPLTFSATITMPRKSDGKIVLLRQPFNGSWYQFESIKVEKGNKPTDYTTAPEDVESAIIIAQTTANNVQNAMLDLSNDNKITATEKQSLVVEWNKTVSEYNNNFGLLNTFKVDAQAYSATFAPLRDYVTPLLSNLQTTSNIDGALFRQLFKTFYDKNIEVVKIIDEKRIAGIIVGGRNLALNSKRLIDSNSFFVTDFDLSHDLIAGEEYAVTVKTKVENQNSNSYFVFGDQSGFIADLKKISQNEYFATVRITKNSVGKITLFRLLDDNSWYQFESIKIERGNKATDYTPAPEDVEKDIVTAQQTANQSLAMISDIGNDNKLTATEKQTISTEFSRIKAEFSSNQALSNSLGVANRNYALAYSSLESYLTPLLVDLITTSDINGATFRARFDEYYKQNVEIMRAIANTQLDNIEIGGTNLFADSAFKKGVNQIWKSSPELVADFRATDLNATPMPLKHNGLLIYAPKSLGNNHVYLSQIIDVEPNTEYTLSFYQNSAGGLGLNSSHFFFNNTNHVAMNFDMNNSAKHKRIKVTFKTPTDAKTLRLRFGFESPNATWLTISSIKLEKGNKMTGWSPSPNDIEAQFAELDLEIQQATALLQDIGSDNKITASEKQSLFVEYSRVKAEYASNIGVINFFKMNALAYIVAHNELTSYCEPIFANMQSTSEVLGSALMQRFQNYYRECVIVVTDIEEIKLRNNPSIGANLLQNSGNWRENGWNEGWRDNGGGYTIDNALYKGKSVLKTSLGAGISHDWIELEPDQIYTYSAMIKSANRIDGDNYTPLHFWSSKDASLANNGSVEVLKIDSSASAGTWKLITSTFRLIEGTRFYRPFLYRNGSINETLIAWTKLEKGERATDWIPSNKDTEAIMTQAENMSQIAIEQANNAISTANAVQQITSFLETTVNGNVVGTGTLMVGDAVGARAGITGVTDRAGRSVRLFAGSTYLGKNTANWNVLDDGTMNFHHPNGQVAFEFGIINGRFVMNGYSEGGYKIFELSPSRGLVPIAYIPESWTANTFFFTGLTAQAFDESGMRQKLVQNIRTEINQNTSEVGGEMFFSYHLDANFNCWEYYNGSHPDNKDYASYNGYKANNSSRTSNISNGWYVMQHGGIGGNFGQSRPPFTTTIYVYYIEGGRIMQTKGVTLTI